MCIEVYKHCGTWAFTDEARELVHEPFISGIPEIINLICKAKSTDDRETHTIHFSATKFPGYQDVLGKIKNEMGGAWYKWNDTDKEGWLCPATLNYFPDFPENIYLHLDASSPNWYEISIRAALNM